MDYDRHPFTPPRLTPADPMQPTITEQQQQAIALKLATMHLPAGLGDEHNACSIAAINLTLSGELSDTIPLCMSEVIGKWIIPMQDAMPDTMRNSTEWKRLLPLAAGTGREREQERLTIIMNWLWESVLPTVQPAADSGGYGEQWKEMLRQRTAAAAARAAADAAARAAAADAAWTTFNPCGLLDKLIKLEH